MKQKPVPVFHVLEIVALVLEEETRIFIKDNEPKNRTLFYEPLDEVAFPRKNF